jgi:L-aspartate oxidase
MKRTGDTHVLLDLRGIDDVGARFPGLARTCESFGLDPTTTPIPVRPSAHYFIGGIVVDRSGRTGIDRLFGCGEVNASGLHGANRLGSNSLLEGLVYGARAGDEAGRLAAELRGRSRPARIRESGPPPAQEPLDLVDMRNSLRALVNRSVGILRSADGLARAAESLDAWCSYVLPRRLDGPGGWELSNMMTISRLLVAAALERRETRGAHARVDFPERDDDRWRGHVAFRRGEAPRYRPLESA